MIWTMLGWAGDACALFGSWLIARADRKGFIVFLVADALLVGIQVHSHVWNQVALLAAFFGINAYALARKAS